MNRDEIESIIRCQGACSSAMVLELARFALGLMEAVEPCPEFLGKAHQSDSPNVSPSEFMAMSRQVETLLGMMRVIIGNLERASRDAAG